jgi:hypothetical protein
MLHDILNVLSAGPLLDRSCTLWTVNATLLGSPGTVQQQSKGPTTFYYRGDRCPATPARKNHTITAHAHCNDSGQPLEYVTELALW